MALKFSVKKTTKSYSDPEYIKHKSKSIWWQIPFHLLKPSSSVIFTFSFGPPASHHFRFCVAFLLCKCLCIVFCPFTFLSPLFTVSCAYTIKLILCDFSKWNEAGLLPFTSYFKYYITCYCFTWTPLPIAFCCFGSLLIGFQIYIVKIFQWLRVGGSVLGSDCCFPNLRAPE